MSDEEFEREDYGELEKDQENSDVTATINEFQVSPHCETGECTAKEEDPAEEAWLRLMTAVPVVGQTKNITPDRTIQSYALPKGMTVQEIVASLRPDNPDLYALDAIKESWLDFSTQFLDIPDLLGAGLKTLAEDWEGDDYDGFEKQVNTVIKNCNSILEDVGKDESEGIIKLLAEKSESIYEQQGGTECVYPAPKFFLEDRPACAHSIHIRPPFFKTCEVKADDETKVAMEWAGFDPTIVDDVQEERERIYDMYIEHVQEYPDYEEDGMKGETLARTRADEFAERETNRLGTDGQEELQAQASEVNEGITDRQSNVDAVVSEITPKAGESEETTFNDGETELDGSGGLDGGGGMGGAPDMGGAGGLDGAMDKPGDLGGIGGGDTGDLGGTGGLDTGDLGGGGDLDTDNPWDPDSPDPDDVSGGLAGGGGGLGGGGGGLPGGGGGLPGGGAGGGLGAGGGAGGGMGAGGMGGMMGGGGAGKGGGAGAGKGGMKGGGMGGGKGGAMGKGGMGAGKGGMGGGMMGGGGGGRGMGGGMDGEESDSWLTEDDDVWGIGNADDDPYA